MVPATALNETEEKPAVTPTDEGTERPPVLLDSEIVMPPEPTACDNVTVQPLIAPEVSVVGLHESPVIDSAGATRDMDAVCDTPE